jgi:hypothetical protein
MSYLSARCALCAIASGSCHAGPVVGNAPTRHTLTSFRAACNRESTPNPQTSAEPGAEPACRRGSNSWFFGKSASTYEAAALGDLPAIEVIFRLDQPSAQGSHRGNPGSRRPLRGRTADRLLTPSMLPAHQISRKLAVLGQPMCINPDSDVNIFLRIMNNSVGGRKRRAMVTIR